MKPAHCQYNSLCVVQLNNTNILDSDKQLTFDSALLEYAHSSAVLVVDIDELMYTADLGRLRSLIDNLFATSDLTWENVLFGRVALGGVMPGGSVVYSENSDKEVIDRVEECINRGNTMVDQILCVYVSCTYEMAIVLCVLWIGDMCSCDLLWRGDTTYIALDVHTDDLTHVMLSFYSLLSLLLYNILDMECLHSR